MDRGKYMYEDITISQSTNCPETDNDGIGVT